MVTLHDLGLTEDDFKFEIIEVGEATYNNHFSPFSPRRTLTVKICGVQIKVRTEVNLELAQDLESAFNLDVKENIDKILKEEAINCYINSKQFIRKLKLNKIKEKYGV